MQQIPRHEETPVSMPSIPLMQLPLEKLGFTFARSMHGRLQHKRIGVHPTENARACLFFLERILAGATEAAWFQDIRALTLPLANLPKGWTPSRWTPLQLEAFLTLVSEHAGGLRSVAEQQCPPDTGEETPLPTHLAFLPAPLMVQRLLGGHIKFISAQEGRFHAVNVTEPFGTLDVHAHSREMDAASTQPALLPSMAGTQHLTREGVLSIPGFHHPGFAWEWRKQEFLWSFVFAALALTFDSLYEREELVLQSPLP